MAESSSFSPFYLIRLTAFLLIAIMAFLGLPVGVIHAICVYLEVDAVKNLRKVNRLFGEIGAEHLVRETDPVLTEQSTSHVENLSLHPLSAKESMPSYYRLICADHQGPGGLIVELRTLLTQQSCLCTKFETRLLKPGKLLASAKAILLRLPNLQSISLTEGPPKNFVPRSVEHLLECIGCENERPVYEIEPFRVSKDGTVASQPEHQRCSQSFTIHRYKASIDSPQCLALSKTSSLGQMIESRILPN